MKKFVVLLYALLFTAVGGLYARARLRHDSTATDPPSRPIIQKTTRHIVTSEMAKASQAMLDRLAPPFNETADDGKTYKLSDLLRSGPVVLTFLKDGCPCSESVQPYFNDLHAAYPRAKFLGVIDSQQEAAADWAIRFRVGYPLLVDPEHKIIRAYQIENSAYVVIIDSLGRIRKHWPGYSSSMLKELGANLAELTLAAERRSTFRAPRTTNTRAARSTSDKDAAGRRRDIVGRGREVHESTVNNIVCSSIRAATVLTNECRVGTIRLLEPVKARLTLIIQANQSLLDVLAAL